MKRVGISEAMVALTLVILASSVANASLLGASVTGCLGPETTGCSGGPTFDFFFGATKTIADPGTEFTHTQDLLSSGSVTRSADFTGSSLTILIDGKSLNSNPLGFSGLRWSFSDISFLDPAEFVSGLFLVSASGLTVNSSSFTQDSILIETAPFLQNNVVGKVFTASFDIQTSTVPIPPALWLLGSGLLGLIGAARGKSGG